MTSQRLVPASVREALLGVPSDIASLEHNSLLADDDLDLIGTRRVQRLEESVKDLKPQLGRTEASAKDLKEQVEILAANYKEIAEVLRGV